MNFFERQDRARRNTGILVLLFVLAMLAVVVAVTGAAALAAASWMSPRGTFVVPDAAWVGRNAGFLGGVAAFTVFVILVASLFRSLELRSGGGDVARSLGGRIVYPGPKQPDEQRLRNVVEEMAIASGVPVPEVYLLDGEAGVNAFAAGLTPGNAAIGVTRGAVQDLSRDELQGVIAHEFSHILNGDMRLNQRVVGILYGVLFLAMIGEGLLRGMRFSGGRRNSNDGRIRVVLLVAGLSLVLIGWMGVFFGRLIKAAVSREREMLADASAVQFTRNPGGVAGALKVIAAGPGSGVAAPKADEFSHFFFAQGLRGLRWLWATHPPLEERIRAIEPGFDPSKLDEVAALLKERRARREEAGRREVAGAKTASGGRGRVDPKRLVDVAGTVDPQRLVFAAALLSALEPGVRDAAASSAEAPRMILGLLLARDAETRVAQLAAVREDLGDAEAEGVEAWGRRLAGLDPGARLPVLDLALPALRQRTPEQLDRLVAVARRLILADHRVEPFELALARTVAAYREELGNAALRPHGTRTLPALKPFVETVCRAIAETEAAYRDGLARLPQLPWERWSEEAPGPEALDRALDELAQLSAGEKGRLVEALGVIIGQDGEMSVREAELLRAVCAALRVPMPPLVE